MAVVLWAVWPGRAAALATGEAGDMLAACDAPGFAQLLQPEARPWPEARGIWLDAQRLHWPGVAAEGRFVLAASAQGSVVAEPGQPLQGTDAQLPLSVDLPGPAQALAAPLAERFRHLAPGVRLRLPPLDGVPAPAEHAIGPMPTGASPTGASSTGASATRPALISPALIATRAYPPLPVLLQGQLVLVQLDEAGLVRRATRLQVPGVLDDLYAAAATDAAPLGVSVRAGSATAWRLWAPTARSVQLCLHAGPQAPVRQVLPLAFDARTGSWHRSLPHDLSGQSYTYLVELWVPGLGLVRQRVTDPYSLSLSADSRRSWIGALDAADTQPPGWADAPRPAPLASPTDMAIYELHVRDFSIGDASVPAAQRGQYAAFAQARSAGMRHLRALARAGLTDVHLLPVFDLASVPERGCTTPTVPAAPADSPAQQAAVMAGAASDCFNWGYDPLHFNAPEGSYASDADDGALRIREFRQMVMALHAAGLRVGMDVVYNHLSASGQHRHSVLDRIVPGYYQRLDAAGAVERSTCCANSATEHPMMRRLMLDSVRLWAQAYRIDSFRFDLMGHQPREAMLALRTLLREDNGREVQLIGEGWNFGEVADGARFVQASQLSLGGSGIATFSDRGRDALRGGGVGDSPTAMVARQGYLNGLHYAPNAEAAAAKAHTPQQLREAADLVRLALAGTLQQLRFTQADGQSRSGAQMRYAGQVAGYAQEPTEVVNYVENHDNHTLWDLNAFKLPLQTPASERARVQVLGLAFTALSQGVPYFHAGVDLLRSKSMDGNSYDSGDWFNRLDWTGRDHHFGTGLPPEQDNRALWPQIAPRLVLPQLRPSARDIGFTRRALHDLLAIRASTRLLRLPTSAQVQARLRFHNTGPQQNPVLIAAELDGRGLAGAGFQRVLLLFNVHPRAQTLAVPAQAGQPWRLHPVHTAARAADPRPARLARWDARAGVFTVPGRTALVYVVR